MDYIMWPINFLPWHEQRQIYYQRRYSIVIVLLIVFFAAAQVIMLNYLNNKPIPPVAMNISHPSQTKKTRCEDNFLKSLTLQAILIADKKYTLLTQDESGHAGVFPIDKMHCWEIIEIENEHVKLKNTLSQKIVLWKMGNIFNGNK